VRWITRGIAERLYLLRTFSFGVYASQTEIFPQALLDKIVLHWLTDIEAFRDTANDRVRQSGKVVNLFDCHGVNFVVKVKAWLVFSVAFPIL